MAKNGEWDVKVLDGLAYLGSLGDPRDASIAHMAFSASEAPGLECVGSPWQLGEAKSFEGQSREGECAEEDLK